jgi:isocitrate dehydrogenase kinase/phosphatase
MKLPNYKNAIVPIEKLNDYLLSVNHSVGSSKARFFRSIGFNEGNIETFRKALIDIARTNQIIKMQTTAYGIKYIIDGVITLPSGEEIFLRTVWIIEKEQKTPRFVTAYPL